MVVLKLILVNFELGIHNDYHKIPEVRVSRRLVMSFPHAN